MTGKPFQELGIPLQGTNPPRTLRARHFGCGNRIVILSGENADAPTEWTALIDAIDTDTCAVITYAHPGKADREEALASILNFFERQNTDGIVLIGASHGGSAALQVASKHGGDRIAAVVAISPPAFHEGTALFSEANLRMITVPKLFISSEFDDCVEEIRNAFAAAEDPRHLTIYPGDAHGTQILCEERESLTQQLTEYIEWAINR